MPTARGLDMRLTLEWYEANLDELEDRIHDLFLINRHRLPVRIEKILRNTIDGVTIRTGLSLEKDFGLHRDDLSQVFLCLNPGFWQRSNFARVFVDRPMWYTPEKILDGAQTTLTPEIENAISPSHCVPSITRYRNDSALDLSVGYGSFVYLYKLGTDVGPDVRRVVTIVSVFRELMHSLVRPILSRRDRPYMLRLKDNQTISEFDLLERFNNLNDKLDCGISYYSDACRADTVFGLVEEVCETLTAYNLGFAFRGTDSPYNLSPFGDRLETHGVSKILLQSYVA